MGTLTDNLEPPGGVAAETAAVTPSGVPLAQLAAPGSQPRNQLKCGLYSAYCHAEISTSSPWLYGTGVAGYLFFWQAETRYGRG